MGGRGLFLRSREVGQRLSLLRRHCSGLALQGRQLLRFRLQLGFHGLQVARLRARFFLGVGDGDLGLVDLLCKFGQIVLR